MSLSKGMYHDESQLGPEEDRIALIHKAFSHGVTLLSTADLYGPYDNHVLIGALLALHTTTNTSTADQSDRRYVLAASHVVRSASKCLWMPALRLI